MPRPKWQSIVFYYSVSILAKRNIAHSIIEGAVMLYSRYLYHIQHIYKLLYTHNSTDIQIVTKYQTKQQMRLHRRRWPNARDGDNENTTITNCNAKSNIITNRTEGKAIHVFNMSIIYTNTLTVVTRFHSKHKIFHTIPPLSYVYQTQHISIIIILLLYNQHFHTQLNNQVHFVCSAVLYRIENKTNEPKTAYSVGRFDVVQLINTASRDECAIKCLVTWWVDRYYEANRSFNCHILCLFTFTVFFLGF